MAIPDDPDPIHLFQQWFDEAAKAEASPDDATAITLATVDEDGMPDARMLLLKGVDERGFVFYTNLTSPKAQQLAANPKAAICIHWKPLERQVRIQGNIEPVTDEEAEAYFTSRDMQSKIGAWASKQSQPLEGKLILERRVAKFAARYALGKVPRPEFWHGYRLIPTRIEFWLKQPYRLHDRLEYTRTSEGWEQRRLYP